MDVHDRYEALIKDLGFFRSATNHAFRIYAEPGWEEWSPSRREVAKEQLTYLWLGIDVGPIDGLPGPQTEYARWAYREWQTTGEIPDWRDSAQAAEEDKSVKPIATHWPREHERAEFYGTPGRYGTAGTRLVRVPCPWTLHLSWEPTVTTTHIAIHQACAESLGAILDEALDHYGHDGIRALGLHRYGGSYSPRRKRGSKSSWSDHAFGCAIDWDPEQNGLFVRAPEARLSHGDANAWWDIWERHGWRPLGRYWGQDWMHVAAVRP